MDLTTVTDWVIFALAFYGLVEGLGQAVRLLRRLGGTRRSAPLSIIVLIRNQEQVIEGVVQHLVSRGTARRGSDGTTDLVLVDVGSTDDTGSILDRLQEQFPSVRLVQLPADHAAAACDTAMFLARGPVSLVLDLRYKVGEEMLTQSLARVWE